MGKKEERENRANELDKLYENITQNNNINGESMSVDLEDLGGEKMEEIDYDEE